MTDGTVNWTSSEVASWLESNGHGSHIEAFIEQDIDGRALLLLGAGDISDERLKIGSLGAAKRIFADVRNLQQKSFVAPSVGEMLNNVELDSPSSNNSQNSVANHHQCYLKPEKMKTFLALLYAQLSFMATSLVMVFVHNRTPHRDSHPPLPDLVLDSLPMIPWAFQMCEMIIVAMVAIFIGLLLSHKHRWIITRRFFALTGTVFFLRCITMLITSLSVPGEHKHCFERKYESFGEVFGRALQIFFGMGLSLQGVRSCGDYIFSGHTVVMTMLNFFITEYTSQYYYYIHTLSWILNLFGIFFILAAHEHYSIDVFIAFYITTRLFMYYHALASNRDYVQRDNRRTKIWFPLFSFFEANTFGPIPNTHIFPVPIKLVAFARALADKFD